MKIPICFIPPVSPFYIVEKVDPVDDFVYRPKCRTPLGHDTGYPHDGRADKDSYPHDGHADKDSYPQNGRADKDSYPHDRHNQYIMLSL